ncbi:tRNA (adenosine(37)-N6)-threonylcarbamoyltransferase complex dimerization subunit type 1 TsaB [bacterium]|nr:tRNA (adenosine(37)-N6)-threonylcarbamoyltransferase complex dimerization subunit type 1 TsaB [bacterium]MBU1154016.1 tRNA (adenosine(37)-N6)-threonylcarbamoyltransferase complex dimerization subunit type 1 TsaB [bacterium]MBU1782911.1 tRNA (adenosine(37)-N6)-threonylcarbamoyltransferase complex dimerization subunit type 1 TsaB [bacterium]MBU2599140.1 tRNA (adenosine(37)-N6)-threonylcarbamoyltransferase complex dimerization subunit type 1 TsaB [bacterium]
MIVLGIETSTSAGSLAIVDNEKVLAEYTLSSCSHSVWLMVTIKTVLKDVGLKIKDLQGISTSVGPGAFTSLRVGVSSAKGLAQSLNLPLATISSLEVLAANISFTYLSICPTIDAKRKEVYAAFFKYQDQGLRQITEDLLLTPLDLALKVKEPTIFIGNGVLLYQEILRENLKEKAIFLSEIFSLPRASLVASLGEKKIKEGKAANLFEVEPLYLRSSV